MKPRINIMWHRRDLRLHNNAALFHALKGNNPVLPIFIFDQHILSKLDNPKDARVSFIHQALEQMQAKLLALGASMEVYYGDPLSIVKQLLEKYEVEKMYTNHDYEPSAIARDQTIADYLNSKGIAFATFKDQVIFEKSEIVKADGLPYTIFTPYANKWKANFLNHHLEEFATEKYYHRFYQQSPVPIPSLASFGFQPSSQHFPSILVKKELIKNYTANRNFPGIAGTSKLGVHLRFGTISIRDLLLAAIPLNETFVNEIIWRDFYQMILWHYPQLAEGKSFKPAYDFIHWRNDEKEFEAWCNGLTGYPIVDAGMRELNATGFMHNRVRMIVASFLTKHLLIDWRWGEAYFAEKLLDFDFAANNGGWQWASGSGCDAAPYFRVFNPYLQTEKFDKDFAYIKKWVPEFQEFSYPKPIVKHEMARERVLAAYSLALKQEK